MALEVNEDRINRWKCLICGSKHKKVIKHFRESDGVQIGYTLFCCNCGHLDPFAWTVNAARDMCGENIGVIGRSEVTCGLDEKDLVNCEKKNCPYRPEPKPKGPSQTVKTSIAKPVQKPVPIDVKGDPYKLDHVPNSNIEDRRIPIPNRLQPVQRNSNIPPLVIPGQVGAPYMQPHGDTPPTFGPANPMTGPEVVIEEPKQKFNPNVIQPDNGNLTVPVITGTNSTGKL